MLAFETEDAFLKHFPSLTDVMKPLADDFDPNLILQMSSKMVCLHAVMGDSGSPVSLVSHSSFLIARYAPSIGYMYNAHTTVHSQVNGVSLESFLKRNPEAVNAEDEVHVDMTITQFEHNGRVLFTALFRDIGYGL